MVKSALASSHMSNIYHAVNLIALHIPPTVKSYILDAVAGWA